MSLHDYPFYIAHKMLFFLLVSLVIPILSVIYEIVLGRLLTVSFVHLAFNMSWEYEIFQAFYSHY